MPSRHVHLADPMDLRPTLRAPHEEHPQIESFRARLLATVRHAIAWHPELTHASISAQGPDGATYTAFAKKEGKGEVSAWIRDGGVVEPEQYERDRTVVAQEEIGERRAPRAKKVDPRIFGREP